MLGYVDNSKDVAHHHDIELGRPGCDGNDVNVGDCAVDRVRHLACAQIVDNLINSLDDVFDDES